MRNVSCHDHIPIQNQTGGNRVLGEGGQDLIHGLIQVQDDRLLFSPRRFRQEAARVGLQGFEKYAVPRDLCLDVSVRTAAHA